MQIAYLPLDTETVRRLRAGGPDAYGLPPERAVSDGQGAPCRHCLRDVPAGQGMLILAHRPFPEPQPYAETGPIFLCAEDCAPWAGAGAPPVLETSPDYLVRGYDARHRIRYGTGRVVPRDEVPAHAARLLEDPQTAHVDVRSARNNCYLMRICRTPSG